jgi:AcrR family transcriptional regulator
MELQPRGRKRELRGNVRQRKLVTSLEELLNEGKRFSEILIEDIAKRAEITRGAFYYFFESKEEVLLAAAQDLNQQVEEATNSFFEGTGEDIRREIRGAFAKLGRLRYKLRGLTRALSDAAAHDPQAWNALEEKYEAVVPRVAARLRQTRSERGHCISEAAALNIARSLVWGNERNFYRLSLGPSTPADWDELSEALSAIWIGTFIGAEN